MSEKRYHSNNERLYREMEVELKEVKKENKELKEEIHRFVSPQFQVDRVRDLEKQVEGMASEIQAKSELLMKLEKQNNDLEFKLEHYAKEQCELIEIKQELEAKITKLESDIKDYNSKDCPNYDSCRESFLENYEPTGNEGWD